MYSHISSNKRKTWLLIILFVFLILALGYLFGAKTGDPSFGIILATILAVIMALTSYFAGDKIALATNKAKRLQKTDAPELWRVVENLSITAGCPMPKLYLIPDRSPNAFATGRSPDKASIAVTAGLLERLNKTELEGVIAHELSHIKNYDIRVMMVVVVLVGIIMLLSDWLMRSFFFSRGDREKKIPVALAFLGLTLAILSPLFAELIKLAISRKREFLADASGALLTRYPDGLASALQKISSAEPMKRANHATAHLYIANPFGSAKGAWKSLFSTHPPLEERVRRLNAMT
jgi:heat shock protein HtpX